MMVHSRDKNKISTVLLFDYAVFGDIAVCFKVIKLDQQS